jgi:hypothetical protein
MGVLEVGVAVAVVGSSVALWRGFRHVGPRDLVMVARATGSPRACLHYLRFCWSNARS